MIKLIRYVIFDMSKHRKNCFCSINDNSVSNNDVCLYLSREKSEIYFLLVIMSCRAFAGGCIYHKLLAISASWSLVYLLLSSALFVW